MPCQRPRWERERYDLPGDGDVALWLGALLPGILPFYFLAAGGARETHPRSPKDNCQETNHGPAVMDISPPTTPQQPGATACFVPNTCTHSECESLKQSALSQHWFFFRWQASGFPVPSRMHRLLRVQLGNRDFRYCAALTKEGVFEVMLRFDKGQLPSRVRDLVPVSRSSNFCADQSEAWTLDCCGYSLEADIQFWLHRLGGEAGTCILGDRNLPHVLLAEARAASGPEMRI